MTTQPDPTDPQMYSCEQCGTDILESEIVEGSSAGDETFCSKDCADEWDLEQAEDAEGS